MQRRQLDQQLQALHDKVSAGRDAPAGQRFFDECAADAAAILARADSAGQAGYAIERIGAIFDEIGVDAQRLLSSGQRGHLQVQ